MSRSEHSLYLFPWGGGQAHVFQLPNLWHKVEELHTEHLLRARHCSYQPVLYYLA